MTTSLTIFNQDEIFKPVPASKILGLLEDYSRKRSLIFEAAERLENTYSDVLRYFMDSGSRMMVESLFDAKKAVKKLNSSSWQKALIMTDVYSVMPQKRRTEWDKQIDNLETPDFYEEAVIPTLEGLLRMRPQFLAERVDGIFRSLSGKHLTNRPEGFTKRMIIARVVDDFMLPNRWQCGHINDLRCVVAKIMGRDEPNYWQTSNLISTLHRHGRTGEWVDVDGGALRMRVYKVGTAHIEIHPDMAWRLNAILAHLHPMAIPSELRTKPKKTGKVKKVELIDNLIPFKVLDLIANLNPDGGSVYRTDYSWSMADKHLTEAARQVMTSLGAVCEKEVFRFDYDATEVLREVMRTGSIPNQKSYQFYPTPKEVASQAVEWTEIGPEHTCLEPSAGQGGISDLLPAERTTCVEVSKIHCAVLRSKGYTTIEGDFLEWAPKAPQYDRIVMNPPFSEGRWRAHLETAAGLLASGGVLVAILPESARSMVLEGLELEKSAPVDGSLFGVSIGLVMMKWSRGEVQP